MRALLDTHVFLWWIADDPRLSREARELLGDSEAELFLSAASAWEMAIKVRLGKLDVSGDLAGFVTDQIELNRIQPLPVQLSHALYLAALPSLHRDPFDRLLVAQSVLEKLPVVTGDPWFARYGVEVVW